MKWKYRIIQLKNGAYVTQFKAKGFFGFLTNWSVGIEHENYLEAQMHCKRMLSSDMQRMAVKRELNKQKYKVVEIFE